MPEIPRRYRPSVAVDMGLCYSGGIFPMTGIMYANLSELEKVRVPDRRPHVRAARVK
jgi:hypothetical protein